MTPNVRLTVRLNEWDKETVEGVVALVGGVIILQINPLRTVTVEVPADEADAAIAALQAQPAVEVAARTGKGKSAAFEPNISAGLPAPMARYPFTQPWLADTNVYRAWQYTKGGGVGAPPYGHVDNGFALNVIPTANSRLVASYNGVTGGSALHFEDHGTATLNHAAGGGDHLNKPYGVAPEASLLVASTSAAVLTDATAAGIVWCADLGAKVINMSLGFGEFSSPSSSSAEDPAFVLWDAITYAYNQGAVVICSAGNDAGIHLYPQSTHPHVFVVGGIEGTHEIQGMEPGVWMATGGSAATASYGDYVDFVARHVILAGALRKNGEALPWSGTSFTTPNVAGIVQLVLAAHPALTGWQAAQIVKDTSVKPRPLEAWMYDAYYPADCGLPDAEAAVLKALALKEPGTVRPYLRVHGVSPRKVFGEYGSNRRDYADTWDEESGSEIVGHVGGQVGFQVEGFCSVGPVTEVELWINGVREYLGPPTTTFGALYEREEWRDRLWDLRVIARTATGQVGTKVYATDAEQVGTLNSAAYTVAITYDSPVSDSTATSDSATAQVISPASVSAADSTAQGDSASCLLIVPASVATPFLLAASILVAVLYDTATADTGAFADAVTIAQPASQADGTAGADTATIAITSPATDATVILDGVGATVGVYASAADTASGSDSGVGVLSIVAAASDAATGADTTACELVSPAAIDVTDSTASTDTTAIVAAIGSADATGSSDAAYGYVGMLASAADATTSSDVGLASGSVRPVIPRLTLYDRTPRMVLRDRSPALEIANRSPRMTLYERSDD
jgi:hypothetical protein